MESGIIYQNGLYWVAKSKYVPVYMVFREKGTHAETDSAYTLTDDGLSLAKARCDYLASKCRYTQNKRGK